MSEAEDEVQEALSAGFARISENARFTVAEFGADGVRVWLVYRDENGTPQAKRSRPDDSAMADPDTFYQVVAPAFIVRTSTTLSDQLLGLLPAARNVPVYDDPTSVEEQLRLAIMDSPLLLAYELAVLRQLPAGHPQAGRLVLTGHPLFPQGAKQGHQVKVRVRVEATDGNGTAFAVVTREPRRDVAPNDRRLRPVQIETSTVPPGSYELTAVLTRPGRVEFTGLPVRLARAAVTSWDDLRAMVPESLARPEPVHLVCLIEVSGGENRLKTRIDRLSQVIDKTQVSDEALKVSVVAYGPHSVSWAMQDEPPAVQAWAASADVASQKLRGLAPRAEDKREYQGAAQLECALEMVASLLDPRDGRPVLVTAGGRPPHPPKMDVHTRIIRCPDKTDWREQIGHLDARGTCFGSLRDANASGDIWAELGRHSVAVSGDTVDLDRFVTDLGLRTPGLVVPFPFIDRQEGS